MSESSQAVVALDLMSHVAVDTLLIDVGELSENGLMTSCRRDIERIRRRNACTSHADSCRIYCGVVAASAAN